MYGLHGAVNHGRQSYSVGYLKKKPFLVGFNNFKSFMGGVRVGLCYKVSTNVNL